MYYNGWTNLIALLARGYSLEFLTGRELNAKLKEYNIPKIIQISRNYSYGDTEIKGIFIDRDYKGEVLVIWGTAMKKWTPDSFSNDDADMELHLLYDRDHNVVAKD